MDICYSQGERMNRARGQAISHSRPSGCVRMWYDSALDDPNAALQASLLYGRSPVWILLCTFSELDCVNAFRHTRHLNGRSPVCTRM